MSCVWEIDSDFIKDMEDIKTENLFITPSIEDFLNLDKDTKYFIVSPKGFGKTLFLKYKRILYQEKYKEGKNYSVYLIPEYKLIDDKKIVLDFDLELKNFLNSEDIWRDIWLLVIIISVIKNIEQGSKKRQNEDYVIIWQGIQDAELKEIIRFLNFKDITPFDYLETIINLGYKGFYSLRTEINILLSIIRGKRISTAVFLEEVNITIINENKILGKQLLQHISKISQIGLMRAVRDLSNINQHIKVFSCIRSESYMEMRQSDEFSLQMIDNILSLNYSKKELEEIFITKIKCLNKNKLVNPKYLAINPIYAFLGLDKLSNNIANVKNEERVFDYIYRHTLKRPRDLMIIGNALANLSSKNQGSIKKVIEEKAGFIASEYIKDIMPYLTINMNDLIRLYSFIDTNIIDLNKLQIICCKFNNETSHTENDYTRCLKTPIFIELYNIGLLGIVKKDSVSNKSYYQTFLQPGESSDNSRNILPYSPVYFIHPMLNILIRCYSSNFKINTDILVGDGSPYNLNLQKVVK